MLSPSPSHNDRSPAVQPQPQPQEMEVSNVSRHSGRYSPLALESPGDEIVAETVVNVDELLRNRQFQAPDGVSESPNAERQGSSVRQLLTAEVHHVASETWLITRLSLTLLRFLGSGTRWIAKFLQLVLYAVFLLPGFIQIGYYYFFSKSIQRGVVFGDHPRNRLDLYRPAAGNKARPSVIFVTGGAWIIGYKAWGALLARQLVERNIIVTCIDYRNFPQGTVGDMVSDVSRGIGYVCQNIENWGGDPNKIYLAGQSAGAHIGACALLDQAKKEISEGPDELTWKAFQIKCYFALSGGYNLRSLVDHFNRRGLHKSLFFRIMEGEESLQKYSPECIARSPSFRYAVDLLPPITLFHGEADYSIPCEASVQFKEALQSVGATATTKLYPDKTHTDLFLQDPMRGGKNDLLADILEVIHADDAEEAAEDAVAMMRPRLVPECLLQLARWVSPF